MVEFYRRLTESIPWPWIVELFQECIYPAEYEGHLDRLMIKREELLARASALAQQIRDDYKGGRPVLVCVLKGANPVSRLCISAHC